ncbi:CbrC family protein [Sporosarcina sp. FSL K6-1522]|uniref:CbrC family protein n=1 Tax=Sporosarcina sp. FSL K6-1522 TaxID=2921554 RepID=UPI00315ADE56
MNDDEIYFKYSPNIRDIDVLEAGDGICNCCEESVSLYYPTMYCVADIHCLCLSCIASGAAAAKFEGRIYTRCGNGQGF